jgi:hypothetical protein
MKKFLFTLIAFSLLAGASCQEKIDIEKEKEAIKAVIEKESNSHLARDNDRHNECFVQDDRLIVLGSADGILYYSKGWSEISLIYEGIYAELPDPVTDIYQYTNYNIEVNKASAWAVYDQIAHDAEGEFLANHKSTRFLEKVDGEWKLIYLSFIDIPSNEEIDNDIEDEE